MTRWDLYKRPPAVVLGFHGCDAEVGEAVLAGQIEHLSPSRNDYDWLGNGIYFWEGSPSRALEFADAASSRNRRMSKGTIKHPFVVGAILDLGNCCNLLDLDTLCELSDAYQSLRDAFAELGLEMPCNRGPGNALRFLDRAVVEALHACREKRAVDGGVAGLKHYDSVRAAFTEGAPLYPGAGFNAKTHIQLAIRNTSCIRGYFRPIRPANGVAIPRQA